jgi:CRP-like cAMP-binding protein
MSTSHLLQPMLDKLERWMRLDAAGREAVFALPHQVRFLPAREYILREDERPTHCCLILDGYACRNKIVGSGARQILSVHMRGDVVDLHNSILRRADHNIQTLTASKVAFIPVKAIQGILENFPQVRQAVWHETVVDAAIAREWMIGVGRRDARARTAHLLCELAVRLDVAGLGTSSGYELPMTMDQLADALALTNVSRTLTVLSDAKLIKRERRHVRIVDFAQLARIGDFDKKYLIGGFV